MRETENSGSRKEGTSEPRATLFVGLSRRVPFEQHPTSREERIGAVHLPYGRLERADQLDREVVDLNIVIPRWATVPTDERFKRLQQFALLIGYELLPELDDFIGLIYHGLTHSGEQYPFISAEILRKVINEPQQLATLLLRTEPIDAADDEVVMHTPTGTPEVIVHAGTLLSPERQAWLLLALISDDADSGPCQLLHHLHDSNRKKTRWSRQPTQANTVKLLQQLVTQTSTEQETAQTFANQEKTSNSTDSTEKNIGQQEVIDRLAGSIAPLVIDTVKILAYHETHPSAETKKKMDQADQLLGTARKIIGQQKYRIPSQFQKLNSRADIAAGKAVETESDTRRFRNEEMSAALQKQLATLRMQQSPGKIEENQRRHVSTLLQLQKGTIHHKDVAKRIKLLPKIIKKEMAQLTHDDIALILAMEMELISRPKSQAIHTALDLSLLQKATELHRLGLYFINAKLSNVHDPLMLHMSGGQFCFAHTPIQLQMLSTASLQMNGLAAGIPGVTAGIPSAGVFSSFGEFFTTGASFTQNTSVFAQGLIGFASAGFASTGFESTGKTSSGFGPSPKSRSRQTKEAPQPAKKASRRASFSWGGGSFSGRKNVSPAKKTRAVIAAAGKKPSTETQTKVKPIKKEKKPKKTIEFATLGAVVKSKKEPLSKKTAKTKPRINFNPPKLVGIKRAVSSEKLTINTPEKVKKIEIKTVKVKAVETKQSVLVKKTQRRETRSKVIVKKVVKKEVAAKEATAKPKEIKKTENKKITTKTVEKISAPKMNLNERKTEKTKSKTKKVEQVGEKSKARKSKVSEVASVLGLPLLITSLIGRHVSQLPRKSLEKYQGKSFKTAPEKTPTNLEFTLRRGAIKKASDARGTGAVMAARSLPTNAMVDVADSFNMAREIKMWAHEAMSQPKLMKLQYGRVKSTKGNHNAL